MTDAQTPFDRSRKRPRGTGRRLFGLGVALLLHATPMVFLLNLPAPPLRMMAEPVAIDVELVRIAAPPAPPTDRKAGPVQTQAAASRARPRQVPRPVVVNSDVEPLPVETRRTEQIASVARAPAPETTAPVSRPVPPAPSLSSPPQNWQARVLSHLESFKRYPASAERRGREGVVHIRFTMDRGGRVLSSRIDRGSGSVDLDREALAMLRRAQPLPAPPPDVVGDRLELTTPVEFFIGG